MESQEPSFRKKNLEELVTDLERFLDEVDGQISELEGAEEDE
jgi:hypothetical protein